MASGRRAVALRPGQLLAVGGMLPDTVIGRNSLKRLRVYKGSEHENSAQKPEICEF